MRLDRFCKIVGALMLLFLSLPMLWTFAGMYFFGNDMAELMSDLDKLTGTNSTPSPSQFSTFVAISIIGYFCIVTALALNLFFKHNWLSWIIRGLSNNSTKLNLTEIVIDPKATLTEPPVMTTKPVVEKKKEEPNRNPDEKYMPPAYRK